MRRLHHAFALVGLLIASFGSATVWWRVQLEAGQTVEVSGTEAGSLLWSVGAVVLASYGLQFTLRGALRRIIAALQTIAGLGFSVLALVLASAPLPSTLQGITDVTGVGGPNALALVETLQVTGWHFAAVAAGALLAVSGGLGVAMEDRATTKGRFERSASSGSVQDSVSAWDSLSEGQDPTRQ